MISCSESTQPYVKIPFKTCHGTTIEHNLVKIRLGVEWPETGDDPNLLLYITSKVPLPPPPPPALCFQSNQSVLPNGINNFHHSNQPQDCFTSTYQQQQYFYPSRPQSTINYHNVSNEVHNDAPLTISKDVFNCIHSQPLTTTILQTRERTHANHVPPTSQYRPIPNRKCLSNQHIMQKPVSDLNDGQLNAQISMSNSMSSTSITPIIRSSSTVHFHPQPSLSNPQKRSVICFCSNPPTSHHHNCPALHLRESATSDKTTMKDVIQKSNYNQTMQQRHSFSSEITSTDPTSIFSMQDSMNSLMPSQFQPSNIMEPTMLSANFDTLFTHQSPLKTTVQPSSNPDNSIQQQTVSFSQFTMNNSTSVQTNPSNTTPMMTQQNKNSHQRKKLTIKRNSVTNQDQLLRQNPIDLNQESQNMIILPPPPRETNISTHQIPSNSPQEQQQSNFNLLDNLQTTLPTSSNDTLHTQTNDTSITNEQDTSSLNSMVRSPVQLDILLPKDLTSTTLTPQEIDQVIFDVSKGKGNIIFNNTTSSNNSKRQKKHSLSSQLLWEQNGPTTLKSSSSPHDIVLTPPKTNSPAGEINHLNEPSPQQKTIDDSRRNHSNTTEQVNQFSTSTPLPNTSQFTSVSSSPHHVQSIATKSPITPQSDILSRLMSYPNGSVASSSLSSSLSSSSSSPESVATLTTTTTTASSFDSLLNSSLQMLEFDENDKDLFDNFYPHDPQQHIDANNHALDLEFDMYLTPIQEKFIPSTPRPLISSMTSISLTHEITTFASNERLNSSTQNQDHVYQDFFAPSTPSSSRVSSESQVLQSSSQHDHVFQQPLSPQTGAPLNSNLQSQKQLSKDTVKKTVKTNNQVNNETPKVLPKKDTPTQSLIQKTNKKPTSSSNKTLKTLTSISKQSDQSKLIKKQVPKKPVCTRCGKTQLLDITRHEFPKQQGLLFECTSCGNSSMRSNVSDDERQRRLVKVATEHLDTVECQFCHRIFLAHSDYLMHLRNDHASAKPM